MTCIIKVWGKTVDVEAIYKQRGFHILPPSLTLSGADIMNAGEVPMNRQLQNSKTKAVIPPSESVVVADGDEFDAIPPATY